MTILFFTVSKNTILFSTALVVITEFFTRYATGVLAIYAFKTARGINPEVFVVISLGYIGILVQPL